MKHNGFEIKVSDILNGKITDEIKFENKQIQELPNLTNGGISGCITIQSLDHESLFVSLDLTCSLKTICDHCMGEYIRDIEIQNYTAKYVSQLDPSIKDSEDEILLIDTKNGVIDVEDLIYHAIQLQEPFVNYCNECQKKRNEEDVSDEDL